MTSATQLHLGWLFFSGLTCRVEGCHRVVVKLHATGQSVLHEIFDAVRTGESWYPANGLAARPNRPARPGSGLGSDDDILAHPCEALAQQLVGASVAEELGRVEVRDTQVERLAHQNNDLRASIGVLGLSVDLSMPFPIRAVGLSPSRKASPGVGRAEVIARPLQDFVDFEELKPNLRSSAGLFRRGRIRVRRAII